MILSSQPEILKNLRNKSRQAQVTVPLVPRSGQKRPKEKTENEPPLKKAKTTSEDSPAPTTPDSAPMEIDLSVDTENQQRFVKRGRPRTSQKSSKK
jgi:hypothetical protein